MYGEWGEDYADNLMRFALFSWAAIEAPLCVPVAVPFGDDVIYLGHFVYFVYCDIYLYIYVYIYIHICVYVYIIYIHTYTHTHTHTRVCVCVCMYV